MKKLDLTAINKFPVFIISAVRTGSTVLGLEIQEFFKDKNLKFYDEIGTHRTSKEPFDEFLNYIKTNNNFILKAHAWDLFKTYKNAPYPNEVRNYLNGKASLVRIRRKDFLNQSVSYYISKKTNTWHNAEHINQNTIEVNHHDMYDAVCYVKQQNNLLDSINLDFVLDLYYEDIIFSNTKIIKNTKPSNYDYLYKLAEIGYNRYLKMVNVDD